jgi:hypothetical protein
MENVGVLSYPGMARVVDEELVYVLFCDMVINNNVIIFFYN